MSDWVEFTAKTVSDAVTDASIHFEVVSDLLEYEVIETEKAGIFGIGKRPAKIRARKKEEIEQIEDAAIDSTSVEPEFETTPVHMPRPSRSSRSSGSSYGGRPQAREDRTEDRRDREEREARPGRGERRERGERVGRDDRAERRDSRIERDAQPDRKDREERVSRTEQPERYGRSDRYDREERSDQYARPDQYARSGRYDRVDRTERYDRNERVERLGPAEGPKADEAGTEQRTQETVRRPENPEKIEQVAKKFLEDVFQAMGVTATPTVVYDEKENFLNIDIKGQDMGILIGKRGQTLDALQYLVGLVVNRESKCYMKVKLDTENYRERRKETLENLARNIAYKVKRTKHSVALEPMNPYERRIIHSALQGDKYVETHSEGDEPYRRVVVTLKKAYRDYDDHGERMERPGEGRGNGRRYNSRDRGGSARRSYDRRPSSFEYEEELENSAEE